MLGDEKMTFLVMNLPTSSAAAPW